MEIGSNEFSTVCCITFTFLAPFFFLLLWEVFQKMSCVFYQPDNVLLSASTSVDAFTLFQDKFTVH